MSDAKNNPQNINEAIRRLENATSSNGKSALADDVATLKKAIEDLKPHFDKVKKEMSHAASELFEENMEKARASIKRGQKVAGEFGKELDERVHENPWWAIGIVGIVALLVGFLLGRKD